MLCVIVTDSIIIVIKGMIREMGLASPGRNLQIGTKIEIDQNLRIRLLSLNLENTTLELLTR